MSEPDSFIQAISVTDLSKSYVLSNGVYAALSRVSFNLEQGKILGIIGRSGAGKTTLLRCLNGLERGEGNIQIFGRALSTSTLRTMGVVFQEFHLLSRRTAIQNVALPLEIDGQSQEECYWRAKEALHLVGLENKLDHYPSQLSGGQKQRVAIARAIARQCRLILCDEFTSALDPETTEDILALIKKLAKDLSLTIVLVTHDMNVVRECCDEIVVLEGGECIEKGAVASVLLNPQHPTTRSMVRGLFEKELPQRWQSELSDVPQKGGIALIRLFFTSSNAGSPIFATVIKSLGFDLNIVAGHIDHLRDQAFGSLIVSLAYTKDHLSSTIKAFQENGVSAQTLGFIPSTLRPSDHHV